MSKYRITVWASQAYDVDAPDVEQAIGAAIGRFADDTQSGHVGVEVEPGEDE